MAWEKLVCRKIVDDISLIRTKTQDIEQSKSKGTFCLKIWFVQFFHIWYNNRNRKSFGGMEHGHTKAKPHHRSCVWWEFQNFDFGQLSFRQVEGTTFFLRTQTKPLLACIGAGVWLWGAGERGTEAGDASDPSCGGVGCDCKLWDYGFLRCQHSWCGTQWFVSYFISGRHSGNLYQRRQGAGIISKIYFSNKSAGGRFPALYQSRQCGIFASKACGGVEGDTGYFINRRIRNNDVVHCKCSMQGLRTLHGGKVSKWLGPQALHPDLE